MFMRASVNAAPAVAAFRKLDAEMQGAMMVALREQAPRVQRGIQNGVLEFDIFDTGFSHDHVEIREREDSIAIGWFVDTFQDAGFPDLYIVYPVLGTRYMAPRDPITPAVSGVQEDLIAGIAVGFQHELEALTSAIGAASSGGLRG